MIAHRAGVGASCVFLPPHMAATCPTMVAFFVTQFPKVDAAIWQERFSDGLITDGAGQVINPQSTYTPNQHLHYFRHVAAEPHIPFDATVLYQDEHLVVADKPHFLPVTPSGRYVQETLLVRLKNKLNLPHLSPLHRLDRDTAGLVLFGVQAKERGAYQQMFHDRKVNKTYAAIAPFHDAIALPTTRESRLENSPVYMQMMETVGAPNSKTHIALTKRLNKIQGGTRLAQYELHPVTGKRHQLRVHMCCLGIPIVNDGIYPVLTPEQPFMSSADYAKPLQLLAKRLAFTDPITGRAHLFESQQRLLSSL